MKDSFLLATWIWHVPIPLKSTKPNTLNLRFPPISKTYRIAVLLAITILSLGLYYALSNLNAVNGLGPVLWFWGEMGALFLLYGIAFFLTKNDDNKLVLRIILIGALLFRLALVPAGLPYDTSLSEKVQLMTSDLNSEEVVFERFQLFDSDVWRYLWDGHVIASDINPYEYAPLDPSLDDITYDNESDLFFWSDIRENVNYGHVPTVYPPLAEWVFLLS